MKLANPSIDPVIYWIIGEQNIALLVLDKSQAIIGVNPAAQNLLGYSEAQLCKLGLEGLGISNDARLQELLTAPPLTSPSATELSQQIPVIHADTRQLGVIATAFPYSEGRHLLKLELIGAARPDIRKVQEDEQRYRLALESAGIGTWDMDIKRNETQRSWLHDRCFGYSEPQGSWSYQTFLSHVVEEDRARVDQAYRTAMKGGEEYDLRFRVRWPDQSVHWLWSKGRFYLDEDGTPDRVAGIQVDVTADVTLREDLRYEATHDHLTGLWNRAFFEANLSNLIERCRTNKQSIAVILIDIDHFKRFNDAFNHTGGDIVIRAMANRIEKAASPETLVARFEGDEFVMALPETRETTETSIWINNLINDLSRQLPIEQGYVKPTVSVGVSFFPEHGSSAPGLLKSADIAMYEAKRCGRATYRVFDPATSVTEVSTLMLADRLPDALASGEIQLFYQPQFDIGSQRLIGMEALLRWIPADGPAIATDVFVGAAEHSGFISVLGDWVIHEACKQISEWRSQGLNTVPVAINVSGVQFLRGQLTRSIKLYLEQFQLPGHHLEVEITETAALDNTEAVLTQLHELRRAGLSIAIDDFGTGFSSLSYLQFFPVNRIKIDRSFVNGCLDTQENAAICRTIISLANNLSCQVIAEGVEHPEQLDFLIHQGCQEVQGYLFAKPMSGANTTAFLKRENSRSPERPHYQTARNSDSEISGQISSETNQRRKTEGGVARAKSREDFAHCLREAWHAAARSEAELALIWIGIDNLELVNESYGPGSGDLCVNHILTLASALAAIQSGLEVFRMADDNVVLFCRDTTLNRAFDLGEQLKHAIEASDSPGNPIIDLDFTASFGVHSARSNGTDASMEQFLSKARQALYTATASGKNQIKAVGDRDERSSDQTDRG